MSEKKVPVWMDCVAVLIAVVACGTSVGLVEWIGHQIYQPPEIEKGKELTEEGLKILTEYIKTAPVGALLFVVVAHSIGCLVGGFVACVFRRRFWLTGVLIVGVLFTVVGIVMFTILPHPTWMKVLDIAVYIPSAIAGGLICNSLLGGGRGVATDSGSE